MLSLLKKCHFSFSEYHFVLKSILRSLNHFFALRKNAQSVHFREKTYKGQSKFSSCFFDPVITCLNCSLRINAAMSTVFALSNNPSKYIDQAWFFQKPRNYQYFHFETRNASYLHYENRCACTGNIKYYSNQYHSIHSCFLCVIIMVLFLQF